MCLALGHTDVNLEKKTSYAENATSDGIARYPARGALFLKKRCT